ncbi:hypothetical protein BFV94_4537 [Alteromonas macleodii]|uniref:Uncharacterized protein n=1 Tax=Alteromonas macleodii TaxID=28108 RepID=A0AB36FKU3_ALTMA|nr:hypothetical protein BFV93_4754 [Alteromonas macleodii]OES24788.1 hypothetical protein BFV95_4547 [Alteromonas macleodii]OES25066.1 hypothetical protein BFV94_4537 [Alteromonas macleodii]OES39109.1 hypothetical protein BFV96_4257 [Alteromonas macleodii]
MESKSVMSIFHYWIASLVELNPPCGPLGLPLQRLKYNVIG